MQQLDDFAKFQKCEHPDLVDWEKLDEATHDCDREPLRDLADMLAAVDYCIVKVHRKRSGIEPHHSNVVTCNPLLNYG